MTDVFWPDQLPEGAEELLARASREFTDLSEEKVIEDLVQLARGQSADPVRRYVFLLEARHLAEQRDPLDQTCNRLDRAAAQVLDGHQVEIQAFFETTRPLQQVAEQRQALDESRRVYFDWVLRAGKINDVFTLLLEQLGPEKLEPRVQEIRQVLVADLCSKTVNANVERMRQQQMDLENNRLIWSLLDDGKKFLKRMRTDVEPPPDKVANFCKEVLHYAASVATERKLSEICKLVSDDANTATRASVAGFMRKLPLAIWSGHEARDTLLSSMFAAPSS